jgi:alkaline phosphatase D
MGHSRRPAYRRLAIRKGVSRRDFLKRIGLTSAALTALPLLNACGNSSVGSSATGATATTLGSLTPVTIPTATAAKSAFIHGVATGDPLSDRIIFWTRITPPVAQTLLVTLVVATDTALKNLVQTSTFTTDASRDYTVKIDQLGLQPATTYYYQFSGGGAVSPIGRTKTLPLASTALPRLRAAVVVCSSLAHGYFNSYNFVAKRADLDLVIHLGDYIYEYSSDANSGDEVYGTARVHEPINEIRTLSDYRIRHAQYKREPETQAMHRQHPMIAIWDDHEFADNAYINGAVNHQPDRDGVWSDRVTAALQAYYEWMPTRPPDPSNLKKNYRSFQIGNLVDLMMLEERVGFRDVQLSSSTTVFMQTGDFADPKRQLLGAVEEAWLFDKLRTSKAHWKLVGQGVMFGQLKAVGTPNATGTSTYINSDQWDGYDPARTRVLNVLAGDANNAKVNNTVVLTGDIHSAWAMDLSTDPNNPAVYNPATGSGSLAVEFVCTSVTSPFVEQLSGIQSGVNANPADPHIKYTDLTQHGYMVLDITPDQVLNEFWTISTIAAPGGTEAFATGYTVAAGANHLGLVPAVTASTPPANPPVLAP